jgi:hypothetical protein
MASTYTSTSASLSNKDCNGIFSTKALSKAFVIDEWISLLRRRKKDIGCGERNLPTKSTTSYTLMIIQLAAIHRSMAPILISDATPPGRGTPSILYKTKEIADCLAKPLGWIRIGTGIFPGAWRRNEHIEIESIGVRVWDR